MKKFFRSFIAKSLLASLLGALILTPLVTPFTVSAADTLITQQFGDGVTTTFTPGTVASGKVLRVTVNGVGTSFVFASSTTITFATAPANKSIINFLSADPNQTIVRTSGTVDFASAIQSSIAAEFKDSADIYLQGVQSGDPCMVGYPGAPTSGGNFMAFASSGANYVVLRFMNFTSNTAVDPASQVFNIACITRN